MKSVALPTPPGGERGRRGSLPDLRRESDAGPLGATFERAGCGFNCGPFPVFANAPVAGLLCLPSFKLSYPEWNGYRGVPTPVPLSYGRALMRRSAGSRSARPSFCRGECI